MAVIVGGGCATSARVSQGETPPNFSMDLTVLVSTDRADAAAPRPHHLRQSRFVVFPDGRLHYGQDESRGAAWLPPAVRVLDSGLKHELWLKAREAHFDDPERGEAPGNHRIATAAPGEVLYLLTITAEERRWAIVRSSRIDDADPAMRRFVEHLARLAFAEPPSETSRAMQPRYDFGPDPYARYR